MAKKSMIARDRKRAEAIKKYEGKRSQLKAVIKNPNSSVEEIDAAVTALQKLPRNGSPCRYTNRCSLTGRPKGYYRKFGLGRNKLREKAMEGAIPGLVMSSW